MYAVLYEAQKSTCNPSTCYITSVRPSCLFDGTQSGLQQLRDAVSSLQSIWDVCLAASLSEPQTGDAFKFSSRQLGETFIH